MKTMVDIALVATLLIGGALCIAFGIASIELALSKISLVLERVLT